MNQKITRFIESKIDDFDALIIEDYGKGVINIQLLEGLILLARQHKKIITVDPKQEHFQYYCGVSAITPNRKELENAVRNLKLNDTSNRFHVNTDRLFSDKDLDAAARQVLDYLDLESVLVTLGEHGMKLFQGEDSPVHIPTVAQEVFDVSGAGDTVIATLAVMLAHGADWERAIHVANVAAGVVVGKLGTAVVTRDELDAALN